MRGDLRFDMAIKPGELGYLHGTERDWLPLIEAALGPGYRLMHMVPPQHSASACSCQPTVVLTIICSYCCIRRRGKGCFISLAGSSVQTWHSDGDHLSDQCHLPPHAINVFLPLVPLTKLTGPTEFVPGSHVFNDFDVPATPIALECDAGDAVLFDYRIKHRGLANKSQMTRPVLYLSLNTANHTAWRTIHRCSEPPE